MDHFIRFDIWCEKCEHCKTDEVKDPCNECLEYPVNADSRQPINFKPKETTK